MPIIAPGAELACFDAKVRLNLDAPNDSAGQNVRHGRVRHFRLKFEEPILLRPAGYVIGFVMTAMFSSSSWCHFKWLSLMIIRKVCNKTLFGLSGFKSCNNYIITILCARAV